LFIHFALLAFNGIMVSNPIDLTNQGHCVSSVILNQGFNSSVSALKNGAFEELESQINHKITNEKYNDAFESSQKMEAAALSSHSDYWLAVSYYYSGLCTKNLKDYKTSQIYFQKIFRYKNIPFLHENERMFKLFRYSGDVFKKLNHYPEAIIYYKKCLEYNTTIADKKLLISPYINLGTIYSTQHDFSSARDMYLKALEQSKSNDDFTTSIIYNNLGNDEYSQGNFSKAIEYYIQSIQLSEKIKDLEGLAFSYNNLGNIYTNELKDPDKALEYYTKSLEIEKKSGNKEGIAAELNNIGNVYTAQLKFTDAEKSFAQALQIVKMLKSTEGIAQTLESMGNLYSKAGNYNKAIVTYIECIDNRKKNKNEINLANVYNSVGALYSYQKEYSKALRFYMNALEFAKIKKDKSLIKRVYCGIHETYAHMHQYNKAYEYLQNYSNLKDTLLNETISKQIIDIQEKYEKHKIQQKVAMQNLEIKNKSLQRNGILAFLILSIIVFSSIVVIIFLKRKNEKILYERNSKIKDQEIKGLIQDSEIRSMVSMAKGQDNERQRISRELHDRVGSMLSLIKLNLSAYKEESNLDLKENLILLDHTYQEVRNISHNLHSGLLNHFGLKVALNDLKKSVEAHHSIRFNLSFHEQELFLSKETEETVFRVLQELITNSLKHSDAKNLDIQVSSSEEAVSVTVEDDGKGFDPLSKDIEGIGLKNIRYRISSIGGSIEINSAPGQGACFLLYIPVPITLQKEQLNQSGV
jgi:two-component system, NarL family, sensor kinase